MSCVDLKGKSRLWRAAPRRRRNRADGRDSAKGHRPVPPDLAPSPDSRLLAHGSGHLREGRGIVAPSPPRPLRPLPASFSGVLRPPQPDGCDPAGLGPRSQGPPTAEAPAGPRQRRLGESRPRAGRGPSGFPETRSAGGTTVPGVIAVPRASPLHGESYRGHARAE